MSELRLVPAAILTWAVTLVALLSRDVTLTLPVTGLSVVVAVVLRHRGQAVLLAACGAVSAAVTAVRLNAADSHEFGEFLHGELVATVKEVGADTWLLQVRVPGNPAPVPTLYNGTGLPAEATAGADVTLPVEIAASDRAGLGEVLATTDDVEVTAPASGIAAVAATVKERFAATVQDSVGEASQGLFPGMVLGDTSLQDEAETQLYLDTGLSHLSAVSGANVAIVTTVVVVGCRLLTLGPRVQATAAAVALLAFVGLVGTEPSVLRAAVTGLVGLLAVVNSARMEPVHALCLAVIGLILLDSDLAVSYGFALSVAATAGIVALSPLLIRALAPTALPEIIVRALAVAIAADVVTMPLVAMMAGRVSLVSVLANVLVSPAVAPVTVLGLLAAGLCLLPGGVELIPLKMAEPCTWWIYFVAEWCAGLPVATIPTAAGWLGPAWVAVCWGWLIALLLAGHPRKVLVMLGAAVVWSLVVGWMHQPAAAPEVAVTELNPHVVDVEEEIHPVPPGTGVIIVTDPSGVPLDRPTRTGDGVPVLYPHRDGPVTLHIDGSQRAVDGRF